MPITEKKVAALVVTYNRKALLVRCLCALDNQTRRPDAIFIIDNASTDGTLETLAENGWTGRPGVEVLALMDNLGGAGGFASGIKHAVERGMDFAWIMDDDALPELDSLASLLHRAEDDGNMYGSVPLTKSGALSWRLARTDKNKDRERLLFDHDAVPESAPVEFLPFLGLLVSRRLVEQIGLPDEGFFLAADDVDYCFRARKAGASVIVVGASRIRHPAAELYALLLPWRKLWCLKLPPWKRYYDVRNRLFVARNHYGLGLYFKTIPGSILRLIGTLLYEERRLDQIKAFWGGMVDGLAGKKGRRHLLWGIKP
jgi:glycosyltransferase involved in cell wall biosynthesis